MKIKINEEDKLIIRYSEFKLALLTVVLLFFIVFPFFLPARISIHENLYFVVAVLITWLASAVIFLLTHIKSRIKYSFLRYPAILIDVLFLGAILFAIGELNSNYFFLFAFIIFGAAFYLDIILVASTGVLSSVILLIGFFIQSKALDSSAYFVVFVKIVFILVITYFVYLFVLSFKEIVEQKIKINKISLLNRNILIHFSNQLRAPLPVIRDFIELLILDKAGPLNDKQKKILCLLHENTSNLIEDSSSVIYYNQLKRGELYINKKEVNLISLIKPAVERRNQELLNKNIKLIYRPRKKFISAWVDGEKFLNAFFSIFDNTISRAKKSSIIKIIIRKSEYSHYLQIRFIYTGIKFPGYRNLKAEELNLYVANQIIILLGGNLSFASKENQKEEVIIILPSK